MTTVTWGGLDMLLIIQSPELLHLHLILAIEGRVGLRLVTALDYQNDAVGTGWCAQFSSFQQLYPHLTTKHRMNRKFAPTLLAIVLKNRVF
jgi:hypothetical protein